MTDKPVFLISFFAVIMMLSCKPKMHDQEAFNRTIEKQNSYNRMKDREVKMDFRKYFTEGAVIKGVLVTSKKIGMIRITSGKLVACDPFYVLDSMAGPFTVEAPRGIFPVYISVVYLKEWGSRVAFIKIQFSGEDTVRYEKAVFRVKGGGTEYEYGVDSGTGSVMDLDAARLFARDQAEFEKKHRDGDFYTSVLEPLFRDDDSWAEYPTGKAGNNVFIVSSGLGDGTYASYWGYDKMGKITVFITDFSLMTPDGAVTE